MRLTPPPMSSPSEASSDLSVSAPQPGPASTTPPGAPARSIRWSGMTHPGRFRPNNEDAFIALMLDGHNPTYLGTHGDARFRGADFVFAVSDGIGGGNMGEFASRTAVDKIMRLVPRAFHLSAGGLNNDFQDILGEVIAQIHETLSNLGRSYEECANMGATLTLTWFTPEWMYFAHVGDSRIYYLPRGGALKQVTHDHSQVGWLRRTGRINEREARTHPARHSLQQALGGGNQFIDPHIGAVGLQDGDRFLICSDGLIDGLWDHRIEELLQSSEPLPELVQTMVRHSLEDSGRDNTTAILVEVLADGP